MEKQITIAPPSLPLPAICFRQFHAKALTRHDMMSNWFSCRVARQLSPLHSSKQSESPIHDAHIVLPFLSHLQSFHIMRSLFSMCPFFLVSFIPAYRPDQNTLFRMCSGSDRLAFQCPSKITQNSFFSPSSLFSMASSKANAHSKRLYGRSLSP